MSRMAPAANSFFAAARLNSLNSRSTRMNPLSSLLRALRSKRSASSPLLRRSTLDVGGAAPVRLYVLSLFHYGEEFFVLLLVDRIAVIVVRESAALDVFHVRLEAGHCDLGEVAVALCEFRLEVGEYAEQVIGEQDLPVGAIARADADGRDLELARDHRGDLRRHGLEFEHKAAGVLDGESILEDLH